jgi:hypothetical protein
MGSRNPFKYQISKFGFKVIFLFCFVFIADQITGNILRKLYFSQKAGEAYRTTFAMDSTNAELLIFGSSRASHHYVPEIFEERLKMTYYNTGRDGSFILYNYAVLKVVLSRYSPQIIVLDINPTEFYFDPESYERLSSLLPYYSDHPEIRSMINLRSHFEKIKLLSSIYPFNGLLTAIGIGNLKINKKRKSDDKGYIPLYGKMNKTELISTQSRPGSIDTIKLQALDSISELCSKNGIKLFICFSPIFARTRETKIDTLIVNIVNENRFKYFNFSNEPYFLTNPDLFRDINHLNQDGAIYYSSLVLDSILPYCRNDPSQTR